MTSRTTRSKMPPVHRWRDGRRGFKHDRVPLIGPETRIATIGSCFASELARSMGRLGLRGAMHPGGLVYNTRSIRQEIERAFGGWPEYDAEPVWKIAKGFISPFNHPTKVFPSELELKEWEAGLHRGAKELFSSAELIVITLGLIEVWLQPRTGNCYRYVPHAEVFEDVGAEFHRLTVAEMREDLRATREVIRAKTDAGILLTVSPVPLHATFTASDVRVANVESKSRIRAAVSEFLEQHPDVHYFHSYELVVTADAQSDFMREDGRHVQPRAVDYIVSRFLEMYAKEGTVIPEVDSSWLRKTRRKSRLASWFARRAGIEVE